MRERELAQRERDLVEQQRVVAEEYRLLRSAKPAAVATREIGHAARANASSGTPWPPVTAGDTSRRVAAVKRPMPPRAVPRPQIAPFASSYRDLAARQRTGFWAWLKRVLFGVGEPALGNRVGARH
jgi:hypothetical protein